MKLIPMVDYALKVVQTPNVNEAHCWEQTAQRLDKIYFYALFLKTPLSIGMFVPCNEEGIFITKPDPVYTDVYPLIKRQAEYSIAENKVLFKGIEVKNCKSELDGEEFIGVIVNDQWCGGWDNFISSYLKGNATIEGLTNLKEKLLPELKESAIKQFDKQFERDSFINGSSETK